MESLSAELNRSSHSEAVSSNKQPSGSNGLAALRTARYEDYEQIAALEASYGLGAESCEKWMHIYANNPVTVANPGKWPIGWVLETSSGKIVGYLGNIPLPYELSGERLAALTGRAWVVDRRYRMQSMSLLNEALRQQADLFLYTSAGPTTSRVFQLLRFPPVPVGSWNTSAFWITNYSGFAKSLLTYKTPRLRMAGVPAGAALFVADQCKGSFGRVCSDLEITPCSGFDDRFDVFWQNLSARRRNVLLAVRTREMLEWHFNFAISNKQIWIALVLKDGSIVAYGIFLRQDVPQIGLKRIRVVDFQSLESSRDLSIPLLLWALQRCRKEGIHMLEYVGLSPGSTIAHAMHPRFRSWPSWMFFYRTKNNGLGRYLQKADAWDPSLFDGDATL